MTNNKAKSMKHSLKRSLLAMTIFFLIVLSAALAYFGYRIYRSDMIARYQNYAGDTIDFLAAQIDGDDLEECIRTGVKSEKYDQLQKQADALKESHDLEFIYIIKPLKKDPPDNMMDVLAGCTEHEYKYEADILTDLGNLTGDAYPADVAEEYIARMDHDPTVTYFRNDTEFGDIYTAIRPVFNSEGEPIAVICGDIMINKISEASKKYAIFAAASALVAIVLAFLFLNYWFGRRIVDPISRLMNSAGIFEEKCRSRADVSDLVMEDPAIHTGDEIEELSGSIISMVSDVQEYARDLVDKDKEILGMKEYVSRMDAIAYRDALTGAGNKAAYEKTKRKLDRDILAGNAGFGIVMADLNRLKLINDNYGHDKGNEYIRGMFRIVSETFTESPIFRIGGDEFVVIVQDEELKNMKSLIAQAKARMQDTMNNSELEPWERISTAFGCAVPEPGDDVDAVFRRADQAMYEDKKAMHREMCDDALR